MTSVMIATPDAVFIARQEQSWTVETHLQNKGAEAVAVDEKAQRIYVGASNGLFRSADGGRSWHSVNFPRERISALATQRTESQSLATVYAGTGPSTFWRSDDGGDSWQEMSAMRDLPSSTEWSFPPQPHTHHVRWIEPDPHVPGKLYVAIEAGALLRAIDGGERWHDRTSDSPYDTHNAATHPTAQGRVYSSAGDGYYESYDGGESWSRLMDGLQHRYLVGVAVDPADANTIVVSAASGPNVSYSPRNAHAYIYRKADNGSFAIAMDGLPPAQGTVASLLTTHPAQPGVFYAANNHGLFRSQDAGRSWQALPVDWPETLSQNRVNGVVVLRD